MSQVAHTNLAACSMRAAGRGAVLGRLCQNVLPIQEFLEFTRPQIVLVASSERVVERWDTASVPQVFAWNGRTFRIGTEPRATWLDRLTREADRRLVSAASATHGLASIDLWLGQPFSPTRPASPAPSSPSVADPDLSPRGVQAHADTLRHLAEALTGSDREPFEAPQHGPQYDLGWQHEGMRWVAEVKSLTIKNENHQLRIGLGQVLDYRHQLGGPSRVRSVLALEQQPNDRRWSGVCADAGVVLWWPGRGTLGLG